jgi:hypothetical protein
MDRRAGIAKVNGVPYTYERGATPPAASAEAYRIDTYLPFVSSRPIHRNVYYVPADRLDAFLDLWGEHFITVVDIQPLTIAEALAEIRQFRASAKKIRTK